MKNLEFYIFESDLWCMFPDGRNERVTEKSLDIIHEILNIIQEQYPDAYSALSECYSKSSFNVPHFQFLMVKRFCKCNFGNLDNSQKDVNGFSGFNFEHVQCPLRGECKYEGRICGAKFNTKLSDAELRVMRLFYMNCSVDEIADTLYLSPNTVKNHIKSTYRKLGIHEKAEFMTYAHNNNIFSDEI